LPDKSAEQSGNLIVDAGRINEAGTPGPVTVIVAAVIIAAGGIGVALVLHRTSPPGPAGASSTAAATVPTLPLRPPRSYKNLVP